LGIYALWGQAAKLRRALAYVAGGIVGVIPLAIYNQLAFGSVTHLSYARAVLEPGRSGHAVLGANSSGFFGVGVPSPRVFVDLLVSSRGLLTLTPVLAMGAVGLVTLYRRGWRAETFTIAAIVLGFLIFNAGYFLPYGGNSPGPRLMVPALPFIALPLAAAYRRYPSCTIALAAASVVTMVTATATQPLIPDANTGFWVSEVGAGTFQHTVALFVGVGKGWLAVVPFLVPVVAAVVFTVLATPPLAIERREAFAALGIVLGWAIVATVTPKLLGQAPASNAIILLAVAVGAGAVAVAAAALAASRAERIDVGASASEA
jgi:hypothetical protein